MIFQKNEQGYALLYVLLTIVLIGLFIPLLMNSILTSTKQFQITEENVKHSKLSEMGNLYVEKTVDKILLDWDIPREWSQPANWGELTEETKLNLHIKPLVISYLHNEIKSQLKIESPEPLFESDSAQFSIESYFISAETLSFQYQISTSINNGLTKVIHEEELVFELKKLD